MPTSGDNFKKDFGFYSSFVRNRRELSAQNVILKYSQRKETKASIGSGEAMAVLAEI